MKRAPRGTTRGRAGWRERGADLARRAGRRLLRGALVAAAVLFVVIITLMAAWPPINDVTTGETPEYPDLQPRAYASSQDRVVAAAVESIDALPPFDVVSVDADAGVVEATVTSRTRLWVDDMTVRVEPNGDGGAIVFIRSRSRVGKADFGQNASSIRRLQEAMDENLGIR